MIPEVLINHGKVFRANGKVSPVRSNYSGNIGVAILKFCEAGSVLKSENIKVLLAKGKNTQEYE
jgi:hypothetical protein